jgi:hypothetical protein
VTDVVVRDLEDISDGVSYLDWKADPNEMPRAEIEVCLGALQQSL